MASGGAPKTLADYQKLSSRSRSNTSPAPPTSSSKPPSGTEVELTLLINNSHCHVRLFKQLSRLLNLKHAVEHFLL